MAMDPKLAEFYGTNQEDVEKTAAAELAEGLAEGEQIDLDNVDPETLEEAAAAVLAGEGGEGEGAGEGGETAETGADGEGEEKTAAQEKVAADYEHADRMGRIMAHAYVQELRGIEKEAADAEAKKGFGAKAKETAGKAGAKAKEYGGKVMGAIKNNPKKSIAAGVGLAGAGIGAAAYKRHKKKKQASAEGESQTPNYDALVQLRAAEILQANGIDPETLEPIEGEKQAGAEGEDVLFAKVEQDAAALLQELGFTFEE